MHGAKLFCRWLATAGSLLSAAPMHSQVGASSSESSRAAAFDRLDRTSRMIMAAVNCALRPGHSPSGWSEIDIPPLDGMISIRGSYADKPVGGMISLHSKEIIDRPWVELPMR